MAEIEKALIYNAKPNELVKWEQTWEWAGPETDESHFQYEIRLARFPDGTDLSGITVNPASSWVLTENPIEEIINSIPFVSYGFRCLLIDAPAALAWVRENGLPPVKTEEGKIPKYPTDF